MDLSHVSQAEPEYPTLDEHYLNRRAFLRQTFATATLLGSAFLLSGCGDDEDENAAASNQMLPPQPPVKTAGEPLPVKPPVRELGKMIAPNPPQKPPACNLPAPTARPLAQVPVQFPGDIAMSTPPPQPVRIKGKMAMPAPPPKPVRTRGKIAMPQPPRAVKGRIRSPLPPKKNTDDGSEDVF